MIRAFFQTHSLTGDSDDLLRRIVFFSANIKTVRRFNDRDTSNLFISDRSREDTRLCAKYIDTELLPPRLSRGAIYPRDRREIEIYDVSVFPTWTNFYRRKVVDKHA